MGKYNSRRTLILIELILLIFINILSAQSTIWTRRFDELRDEEITGIVRDASDNIIIVGSSRDTLSRSDILLLKYNQSGELLWHQLFDTGQIDWGFCVTVDATENIIIGSYHDNLSIEKPGMTKFTPNGTLLWTRMYPELANYWITGITLDADNNIFICGHSTTSLNGMLSKCDTSGNLLWCRYYNWSDGVGFDNIINNNGEIFVTGYYGTFALLVVKLNNFGDTLWTRILPISGYLASGGLGIAKNSNDYLIISGYATDWLNYDALVAKYSQSGNLMWYRIFNFNPIDYFTKLRLDSNENIFACGSSGIWDSLDYITVKVTPLGDTIWARFYNGGYDDKGTGIVIDSLNNPVITGFSYNSIDYDPLTIKYCGSSGIQIFKNDTIKQISCYRLLSNFIMNRQLRLFIIKQNIYSITIYDVQGRKTGNIYHGVLYQGEHSLCIGTIVPGVYFLEFKTDSIRQIQKIVVSK